jgi:Peptidase M10 serralysin C terminal/Bacterial pre-peptidase C-terminal domain/FG-GAP-like repeat/Peptidase M66
LVDVPASTSTTSSITVGGTIQGALEVAGDHDWYRINLTAGQQITISLSGAPGPGGVSDTYLNLRNSSGTLIAHNDDSGGSLNSRIVFTATTSGTYYIDAGAWDATSLADNSNQPNPGPNAITGNYTVSVQPYTPPPVWTYDQIANQLVNGFWNSEGQSARHFAVSQGGTITVNYSTLTAAEQTLAIAALGEWSDIIGVTFTPVTTGGQIRFSDAEDPSANGPVASTVDHTSGGLITSADIQISQSWVSGPRGYGTSLNSYSFQTYIHEIGHALGLGHAGDYNNTADYVQDALYANDSWSTTVMSYFDQADNVYFHNQGFTQQFVLTPMVADIVAMQQMYGLSTTTRAGNTTYGFNSNAGSSIYNAATMGALAYTVFDSAGIDTLDYSGFTSNQLINLNPETFSNVGTGIGNVSIARGTIIENAIGGSGSDTIIGNSVDNVLTGGLGIDNLTGGAGNDTFQDTVAGLNGDTITDFSAGDKIVLTNAALSGFTFSVSGTTLTLNSSSGTAVVHLGAAPGGPITASAAAGGGVQLAIGASNSIQHHPVNDFNGDGRSDILWRNDSGQFTDWLGKTNGGFAANDANALTQVPGNWHIVGTGDFNGDKFVDVLWRDDSGTIGQWLGKTGGGFTVDSHQINVSTNWSVVDTGDFNGDGKADILWRDTNGQIGDWLSNGSGGWTVNNASMAGVSTSWTVAGVGDFNGDGKSDILWRGPNGEVGDWLSNGSGGWTINNASVKTVANNWHVVGVGDFNGDGLSDILWSSDTGQFGDWLGNSNGTFTDNSANSMMNVSTDWHVAAVGDYNGDGIDDVLWRNDNGQTGDWLGRSDGGFTNNSANSLFATDTHWHVEHSPNAFL